MFGNLDPAKLLVILVFALVVIGPERLPKVARQLATAWRELTRMREQVTEEVRSALPDFAHDLPKIPRMKPGSVSSFLNDLTRPSAGAAAAGAAAVGAAAVGAATMRDAGGTSSSDAGGGGVVAAAGVLEDASGSATPAASRRSGGSGALGRPSSGSLGGPLAASPRAGWAPQPASSPVGLDDPAMN